MMMSDSRMTIASLVAELKERRVLRTVLIYVAVAWLIIQAVDIIGPALFLPAWSTTLVVVLLVLGLPFTVLLAWRFDIVGGEATRQTSPEGKAATYIWLTFSVVTLIGGSWLAYYSYTETIAADESTHASFGVYAPPDHSIAVLPFLNLSGNPDTEYFADGLADTVLHRLAQVDQLFVIARTSSFRFKGSDESIESIGRKLNVGAVLEGSIQQVGNQMRIIAQLIDVRSGKHLKSVTYDATTENIFAVQDEISLQVAEALKIELLQDVTNKLTASGTDIPKAHDLFMLGRFHAGKYTPEGVRRGHGFFQQAIALDPTFDLAYVGIADVLIRSPQFEQVPGTVLIGVQNEFSQQAFPGLSDSERYRQAKEALETALVLDDQSAEANAMLGYLETWLGDRSQAEALFRRAIELGPGLVDAHYFYGRYLAEEHRYADSIMHLQKALQLDPANIPVLFWNAIFMRRDMESSKAALGLFERIAELDPLNEFSKYRNPSLDFAAMICNANLGLYYDAVAWLERELAANPELPSNVLAIGQAYLDLGDPATAERWRALAAASPGLYQDTNGFITNWYMLVRLGRLEDARALSEAAFGQSEDPIANFVRGADAIVAGNATDAITYWDAIPDVVRDAIFLQHDDVLSNLPVFGTLYAAAMKLAGDEQGAESYLLRVEDLVSTFRQQGYSTGVLDLIDAQVHAIRGDRDTAIASLRKTVGRLYRWPLDRDPIFDDVRDDPRFQEILALDADHKAEQLRLLREHHRNPPPWSPDYQVAE